MKERLIIRDLIKWYERERRFLPWRSFPSFLSSPYTVFISEIMLQQTTVNSAIPYFYRFIEKWPTVKHLANATEEEVLTLWAGLGYYSRARNLLKSAKILAVNKGFPKTPHELKKYPGIGDYTANAIAAIAFAYPTLPIDGNVKRVFSRLFKVIGEGPTLTKNIFYYGKNFPFNNEAGDFAQALMDLGATICRTLNPLCHECPLAHHCEAYQTNTVENFPERKTKEKKPIKYGITYIVINKKGELLLEKRPVKGLLGGMYGFPGTEWSTSIREKDHPQAVNSITLSSAPIRHTFTHFNLELTIKIAERFLDPSLFWFSLQKLESLPFPTLMNKILGLAKNKGLIV